MPDTDFDFDETIEEFMEASAGMSDEEFKTLVNDLHWREVGEDR